MESNFSNNNIDVEIECAIDSTLQLSIDIDSLMCALEFSKDSDNIGENIKFARKSVKQLLHSHETDIFSTMDNLVKKIMTINQLSDDEKAVLIKKDPHIMRYIISPSEFLKNISFLNTDI